MPKLISSSDMIYLRSTPIPRALESVQQTFWGMYPLTARIATFPAPTIVTRTPADETLFPNDANCRRFNQLSRAFAERTADRWNETDDMKYLNKLMSKWMPSSSPQIAVDSHPRLSGIMDTINSTLAHGPQTRLPGDFYDERGRAIIDKIGVEEWFSGYKESREYRALGIGGLVGDIVERMAALVEGSGLSVNKIGGVNGHLGEGRGGEKGIKFALSGCHDTTLAAILSSLGAFDGEKWPHFTSHIAIELFRDPEGVVPSSSDTPLSATAKQARTSTSTPPPAGFFASFPGLRSFFAPSSSAPSKVFKPLSAGAASDGIARRPIHELSERERAKLKGYYVRIRYNDRPMTIPGCKRPGSHLKGDETFCTLAAFKAIADDFTPKNWKKECQANMDKEKILASGSEQWAGSEAPPKTGVSIDRMQ